MKSIETRMLLADKFPSQIEEKYPDVKVRINLNKNEIEIDGVSSFVNKTQIEMYQMKDCYHQTEISIPKEMADMYMSRYVKECFVQKLKPQKVVAVWEAHDDKLKMMSKTKEMLDQAVFIISKSLSTGAVQLTPENRSIMQSDLWRNLKDSLLQENQGKVKIVDNPLEDIMLVCTDDVHSSVLTEINDFLEKNTTYKTKLTFSENINTLLNRHHLQELQEIARKKNVSLNVQATSFEIAGTKLGIDYAKKEFESLAKKIQKKSHQVSNPDSTHPVLVKLGDEDRDEDVYSIYDKTEVRQKVPSSCAVTASCVAFEVRNIHVVFGDITDLSVDAIVNAADEKLSLCGGLGKAILRKGGDAIASDCKQYINVHGQLGEADVFVSTAGNLKAKSIVHIAGPAWKDGMQEEDEKLSKVVFRAMHQASAKGYKSVALPAISCGAYGYTVKWATGVIVAAIKNFFREMQESELTEIYLCDMEDATVTGFVEGLEKEWGASSVRRFNRRQSSSDKSTRQ